MYLLNIHISFPVKHLLKHFIQFFVLFCFVLFCHTTQLAGSYFPDEGLNLGHSSKITGSSPMNHQGISILSSIVLCVCV